MQDTLQIYNKLGTLCVALALFAALLYPHTTKAQQAVYSWPGRTERDMAYEIERAIQSLDTEDEELFEKATFTFERLGKDGVAILLASIEDDDRIQPRGRHNVLYILGRLGKNATESVPHIIKYLNDKNPDTRAVAANALGKIGAETENSIPYLVKLLYDDERWVKQSAITALKRINTLETRLALQRYESQ